MGSGSRGFQDSWMTVTLRGGDAIFVTGEVGSAVFRKQWKRDQCKRRSHWDSPLKNRNQWIICPKSSTGTDRVPLPLWERVADRPGEGAPEPASTTPR